MSIAPIRTLKRSVGALISYYDGSTLLGTQRVPKGRDVLHPRITVPSKSGKTFVGWSTTNSEANWVSSKVSDGNPLSLYAVYATSSLTVASGTITTEGTVSNYSGSILQPSFVSGNLGGKVEIWYSPGPVSNSWVFNLQKRYYNTATVTVGAAHWGDCASSFDGTSFSGSSMSKAIASGNHTVYAYAHNTAEEGHGWAINSTGVTSLVLSEPIAWT